VPASSELGFLLDVELPTEVLRTYLARYPGQKGSDLVTYGLAVRLAREGQYEESAALYRNLGVRHRAQRMRTLATLETATKQADAAVEATHAARYRLATYISENQERLFFNDRSGFCGYLQGEQVERFERKFTTTELKPMLKLSRQCRDAQEERWQAYLLLRQVHAESGDLKLRTQAAQLAIRCLRKINVRRFGRAEDIRAADIALSFWLKRNAASSPPN
jgi:hypothetical protein